MFTNKTLDSAAAPAERPVLNLPPSAHSFPGEAEEALAQAISAANLERVEELLTHPDINICETKGDCAAIAVENCQWAALLFLLKHGSVDIFATGEKGYN